MFNLTQVLKGVSFDGPTCAASHLTNNTPKVATIVVIEGQAVSFPDQIPKTDSPKISDALSPEILQPTVRDGLFTAYDIHARAAFFSRESVRSDGLTLLALDSNRWEGYHWMGLAAEQEGSGSFPEAEACFRRSVDMNKVGNKDYINLAELSFFLYDYNNSIKYTDEYLHPLSYPFQSALDMVAQFYNSTAGDLAQNPPLKAKYSPKTFREQSDLHKNVVLQGTFSDSPLEEFIKSKAFLDKLSDGQKAEVKASFNCLKLRQCDD